jgi:hypothetical protein
MFKEVSIIKTKYLSPEGLPLDTTLKSFVRSAQSQNVCQKQDVTHFHFIHKQWPDIIHVNKTNRRPIHSTYVFTFCGENIK